MFETDPDLRKDLLWKSKKYKLMYFTQTNYLYEIIK